MCHYFCWGPALCSTLYLCFLFCLYTVLPCWFVSLVSLCVSSCRRTQRPSLFWVLNAGIKDKPLWEIKRNWCLPVLASALSRFQVLALHPTTQEPEDAGLTGVLTHPQVLTCLIMPGFQDSQGTLTPRHSYMQNFRINGSQKHLDSEEL